MSIELRSEIPGDEDAIDMVNCQAFGSMGEAYLIRLIREIIPAFDPQLANTVHTVRIDTVTRN